MEKPATGSLGLSLARPTGVNSEGIYIKHITAGSVVETDGRLKVGDRLWEVNNTVNSQQLICLELSAGFHRVYCLFRLMVSQ